jgi:hypothetical protein
MWREAMMELLDQLEAENPEDAALVPKVLELAAYVSHTQYAQMFSCSSEGAVIITVGPELHQDNDFENNPPFRTLYTYPYCVSLQTF